MQLLLQGAYLRFFPDLRSYVERRLQYALGRHRAPVRRATVSLKNRKPRREAEWRCAIKVKIQGLPSLAADATRPLPSEAIDQAIARTGEIVARAMARRPKTAVRRHRVKPLARQPQWGGRRLELVPASPRARRHR